MKLYATILLFCLSFSFLSADSIPPEYWPERAELIESISPDIGVSVSSGTTFTLHRLEGKQALVTFGRAGTHWINIDDTDIADLAKEIEKGRLRKPVPNLIVRIYKTLFIQEEPGKYRPVPLSHLKNAKIILFYFASGRNSGHADRIKKLHKQYQIWKQTYPCLEMIMIQEDATVFKIRESELITWPTMAVHLSVAYSQSLHLGQEASPSFVLVGSEGNIVQRYSVKEDLMGIFSSIDSILDSKNFK